MFELVCTPSVGAVYRHFESRWRIINDAKRTRKEKVAQNNRKRRNKQAQKRVSIERLDMSVWMSAWLYIHFLCISYGAVCKKSIC